MNLLQNVPACQSRNFLLRFNNLNPVEGMEAFGGDISASAQATWYPRDRHMLCYVNTCSLQDSTKGTFCDVKGVLTFKAPLSPARCLSPYFASCPCSRVDFSFVQHMLITSII